MGKFEFVNDRGLIVVVQKNQVISNLVPLLEKAIKLWLCPLDQESTTETINLGEERSFVITAHEDEWDDFVWWLDDCIWTPTKTTIPKKPEELYSLNLWRHIAFIQNPIITGS